MIRLRVEVLLRLIPPALEAHAEATKKKPANSDSDEDELPAAIAPSAKPPKASSDVKGKNKAAEGKSKNKPVASKNKGLAKQAKAHQREPGPPDEDAPISVRSSDDETSKAKANPKKRKSVLPVSDEDESEIEPVQPKPKKVKATVAAHQDSESEDEAPKLGNKLRWALSQFRTPKPTENKQNEPMGLSNAATALNFFFFVYSIAPLNITTQCISNVASI
ncbi:hypothetical protein B0H13DRAFT_465882 [Mycena leptocephala]|nr:hypothetical protein B0H13DRAFT_465882 [Mycena leptocephala]